MSGLMAVMARFGLFFLSVGVTVSTKVDLHKRIVGGHDCKDNESRHHVRLVAKHGADEIPCGGSLISQQWILTAAHCVQDGWTIGALPSGVKDPVHITDTPLIYSDGSTRHDLMLLKLPSANKKLKPIPLPDCGKDVLKIDEEIHISGHGLDTVDSADKFLSHTPDKLQCVSMQVVDCKEILTQWKKQYPNIPTENWMCGKATKKAAALDDAGGGVVYKNKLHGVIIGSDPEDAFEDPFVFLQVCKYIDWIKNAIK